MQSVICRACASRAVRVRASARMSGSQVRAGTESPLKRLVQDASAFGEASPEEHELQWATQPYAVRAFEDHKETRARPEDTSVLLFPGEGSQFVGMGRRLQDVPAARDLYELASSIVGIYAKDAPIIMVHNSLTNVVNLLLGNDLVLHMEALVDSFGCVDCLASQLSNLYTMRWDVGRVCREGPEPELQRRAQTALLVTGLAALEAAREARPHAVERARAAAGFSLGEISALVFAAALPFDQALRFVELRTAAMQAAATERAGGLLTVWLAPDAQLGPLLGAARDHAARRGCSAPVCQVAHYLFPGCKVLAGDEEALRYVEESGRAWGVRRSARVPSAGALHSPLMSRAQDAVRTALRLVDVRAPALRVVSCIDARPYPQGARAAAEVRRRVARLTAAPARWEQVLHALFARPRQRAQPLTLALGPHAATRATLRMVNARAWDTCVHIDV